MGISSHLRTTISSTGIFTSDGLSVPKEVPKHLLKLSRTMANSQAKPDPSIARGSGRKPILRFVPAAGILQSNQIAERAITT